MIPRIMRLENFLSHADSCIDLTGIGCAVISGKNGHGKSSIIDAMTWALFGKGRSGTVDGFIRQGASRCRVEFVFDLGSDTYRVSRTRAGSNSLLGFDIKDGDNWKPLAGQSIKETEKKIEEVLQMDYRTLINSSFCLQGNSDEFSRSDPGDRKEVLGRILGLDTFEQAAAKIREQGRGMKSEIDTALTLIAAKEQELTAKEKIEAGIMEEKVTVETLQSDVAEYESALSEYEQLVIDRATAASELRTIEDSTKETYRQLGELDSSLNMLTGEIEKQKELLADKAEIEARADEHQRLSVTVEEMRQKGEKRSQMDAERSRLLAEAEKTRSHRAVHLNSAESAVKSKENLLNGRRTSIIGQLSVLNNQAQNLEKVPCAESEFQKDCPLLASAVNAKGQIPLLESEMTEIDKSLANKAEWPESKELEAAKSEQDAPIAVLLDAGIIERDMQGLGFSQSQYEALSVQLKSLESYPKRLTELQTAQEKRDRLTSEHAEKVTEKTRLLVKGEELEESRKTAQGNWEKTTKKVEALEDTRRALSEARNGLSQSERALASLEEQLRRIERTESEASDMRTALKEKEREVELLADTALMLGKNGVQAMLIERAIPAIEHEANRLLERLTSGLSVSLETQRATKDKVRETLDIIIADQEGRRAYEMYSGGEKFRIDFCLRIALSRLLARRAGARLETLIIDEGFGTLDADGLAKILECLALVQDEFRCILVVSHIDEFKESFPTQIMVTKDADGSHVEVAA